MHSPKATVALGSIVRIPPPLLSAWFFSSVGLRQWPWGNVQARSPVFLHMLTGAKEVAFISWLLIQQRGVFFRVHAYLTEQAQTNVA